MCLPLPLLLTHLQAGQAVKEDEVIAQIETDKVTIDIKAPSAGTLEQLLIKPTDTVVAGQVVAVVGAGAAPAAATTARAAATAPPASPVAASTSDHGRVPMIRFPPRVTLAGARISDLPASQYDAAMAEATAATAGSTAAAAPAAAPAAASALAPEPSKAAAPLPPPAAKVAAPPTSKNKLPFVTRPDGRGGPPRRPLTARELELINLGGAW